MCGRCDRILGGGIIERRRGQLARKRERELEAAKRKRRTSSPDWVSPDEKRFQRQLIRDKKERAHKRNLAVFPRASAVTVTRADGSTEVLPAYQSPAALRKVAPERLPIPDEMRAKILARDDYACRYCGSEQEPFEMDHVLAVARGGATSMGNLVTSCNPCNQKKGTEYWEPRPLPSYRRSGRSRQDV